MKFLLIFIFSIAFFQLPAQKLDLIQNQWEAIAKAKTAKEKLMRNCRMANWIHGSSYNLDSNRIQREVDLSQINGFSDLIDNNERIRMVSWYFEIESGIYQYNYDISCGYRNDSIGMKFGFRKCDNEHELSCKPCHLNSERPNEWEGAYYTDISTNYKDTMMYLRLNGQQYHLNGIIPVVHTFSVSPSCKIEFLNDGQ